MSKKRQEQFTVLGKVVLDGEKKRLRFNSPDHYLTQINKIPVDTQLAITISKDVSTRSRSQLAYFMVLAGYIADHTGYTTKEVYPLLIEEVYPPKTIIWKGEERKVRRSVSDVAKMPSYDMIALIEHALATCSELEINVPTAEELGYISNT